MEDTEFNFVIEDDSNSGAAGMGGGDNGQASTTPAADKASELERQLAGMNEKLSKVTTDNEKLQKLATRAQAEEQIDRAVANASEEVDKAEKALADAYDEGEGVAIARAQRELTSKVARQERISAQADALKKRLAQEESGGRNPGGDVPEDRSNLDAWRQKHASWYGVDRDMTRDAMAIHRQIKEAGALEIGSKEYFDALDRQMAQKYPEVLRGSPGGVSNSSTGGPGGAPVQYRIKKSIADGYRRMGFDMDDPKVVKTLMQNRKKAVEKGLLAEQPVSGQVIS
jgi:hypothetical protein